ncbi:MAG: bifunctional adenosylcobinamide kinase/adenosylcobinamide-phosphate guanylyltransferase [Clostridia bacterium]|nr:bifunctional adenosylcobinamide kinase/adenosylcobinamide-phosphate guanylyltransferase [Clostridia bacterium]
MKLYIGGCHQGQAELARLENPGAEIFYDFHLRIRDESDPREFARQFCAAHPGAIVVSNEVGYGVVPVDPADRAWREAVGRAMCILAQQAEAVTRVVCGIGVRIK